MTKLKLSKDEIKQYGCYFTPNDISTTLLNKIENLIIK